ncbi:MAG: TIR domain-containing protein [Verrucomicrobiales bacterium]|nr:TIR domain-containing protein [Verrucomicrobiales bacterium]
MDALDRKKVSVVTKYAVESFTEGDWYTLGQITGKLDVVTDHPRLFRSLSFGDDDYDYCVAQVLDIILSDDPNMIGDVIDHFDIDLWYQQKEPEKYQKVFAATKVASADFWVDGQLRAFISHLSSNKERMSAMKAELSHWGISAFIAHEDIEPPREWMNELEKGLETMDVLVAVIEPGFKESAWCAQEVGFALGRHVDVIPLKAGLDPFGFFGKIQGVQIKGKLPTEVASEIVRLLLKKPKHRDKLLRAMGKAFRGRQSEQKERAFKLLDSWNVATDSQIRALLENSSLSDFERGSLRALISRVEAFKPQEPEQVSTEGDEIPF